MKALQTHGSAEHRQWPGSHAVMRPPPAARVFHATTITCLSAPEKGIQPKPSRKLNRSHNSRLRPSPEQKFRGDDRALPRRDRAPARAGDADARMHRTAAAFSAACGPPGASSSSSRKRSAKSKPADAIKRRMKGRKSAVCGPRARTSRRSS